MTSAFNHQNLVSWAVLKKAVHSFSLKFHTLKIIANGWHDSSLPNLTDNRGSVSGRKTTTLVAIYA